MKIAYLECNTGISGDMTLGALIDAGVSQQAIEAGIDSLKLEGVRLRVGKVIKGGFSATAVTVEHPPQHAHRHLSDIREILERSDQLTDAQHDIAMQIFQAIAQAEAAVHGSSLEKVHFHEVGAIDSIVDIVAAAIGFDLLGVDQIHCSPIPTGYGLIHIDHGICPVPAPGTAELLKGIPLQDVPVEAELTTPTGAAIVKTMVDCFGRLPAMQIEQIGYGAGTKTFPQRANLLRLFVGTKTIQPQHETVSLLETNLDDTTAETIGYTRELLEQSGALDVYTTPIQMKKNRPAVQLSVLCKPEQTDALQAILFEQTGTLGIRISTIERAVLARSIVSVDTIYGSISGKLSQPTGKEPWFQPEFEDCARIAKEQQLPLREIYRTAQAAYIHTPQDQKAITKSPSPPAQSSHHDHDHDHNS